MGKLTGFAKVEIEGGEIVVRIPFNQRLILGMNKETVQLSRREQEVYDAMGPRGMRVDKEIADQLGISVRTVKSHVSKILGKFGVSSRRDL